MKRKMWIFDHLKNKVFRTRNYSLRREKKLFLKIKQKKKFGEKRLLGWELVNSKMAFNKGHSFNFFASFRIFCILLVFKTTLVASSEHVVTTTSLKLNNLDFEDSVLLNITDAQSSLYDRIRASKYLNNPYNLNESQSKNVMVFFYFCFFFYYFLKYISVFYSLCEMC